MGTAILGGNSQKTIIPNKGRMIIKCHISIYYHYSIMLVRCGIGLSAIWYPQVIFAKLAKVKCFNVANNIIFKDLYSLEDVTQRNSYACYCQSPDVIF